MARATAALSDWPEHCLSHALRVCPGETRCGDQLGWWWHDASLTLALADGLGHGDAAHLAATTAMDCIGAVLTGNASAKQRLAPPPGTWLRHEARHPSWSARQVNHGHSASQAQAELIDLFARCDRVLIDTRGVALALVRVLPASGQLVHAGVGNIRALLCGVDGLRRLGCARGIVGAGYRGLRAECLPLAPGDWVALYSDGIEEQTAFDALLPETPPATTLAATLVDRLARDDDDASLLLYRHESLP